MGASFEAANDPGHATNPERGQETAEPAKMPEREALDFAQNAPPIGRDFSEAKSQSREEFMAMRAQEAGLEQHAHVRIATRVEVERRTSERATPEPAPALTPGGQTETVTHKRVEAENERELFLQQRALESQRGEPTREFNHNR